jgi:hypothetical protein
VNEFEATLLSVANDLKQLDLRFALVGGFAVGLRTDPRFTQDLDLAVSVAEDSQAEQATMSLIARGYSLLAMVEQDSTERLATVRLVSPETKIVVDLLFASTGIEPEIVEEAEELDFSETLALPVAQLGHLIAMKILSQDGTRRPQDRVDLANLLKKCSTTQLELAQRSVGKIQERGFHRGKDLTSLLKMMISEFGPKSQD